MARIIAYPSVTPVVGDCLVGTQKTTSGNQTNPTKNFTVKSVVNAVLDYTTVTVDVTSAELLNLQSNAKELVAAQGANTYIKVLEISLFLDYNSSAYTQGGDIEITAGGDFQAKIPNSSGLLTATADTVMSLQIVPSVYSKIGSNTALSMSTGNAIASGNSPLKVKIKYQVLNTTSF